MANGTGNGIGIGPALKEYQQTYLSVTRNKKNPEGRIEKPHWEELYLSILKKIKWVNSNDTDPKKNRH